MTFQVSFDSFGETICENLVENGETIPVTEENKMEYIDKVVYWRFVKRVKVKKLKNSLSKDLVKICFMSRNKWT